MHFASRLTVTLGTGLFQIYLKFSVGNLLCLIGHLFVHSGIFRELDILLLFLTRTFASLPIDLSTLGRQDQSESLCRATLWPRQMSARSHLAAPSSPQGRTIRPPGSLCLPSCNFEHKALKITDLVPPGLFHLNHYFFKVFVQVQRLCVLARHHLAHLVHDVVRASHFFFIGVCVFTRVLGPDSVPFRNFWPGPHRDCERLHSSFQVDVASP